MINSVISAVTKQLGTTFGEGYKYYTESVEQGFKTPCFTVGMLLPTQRSTSAVLYERTMPIIVHYFTDSKTNVNNECYAKSEEIIECLEYLPFEDTILRGESISSQITDGVLQIFITYRFTTKRVVQIEDAIETLESNITQA